MTLINESEFNKIFANNLNYLLSVNGKTKREVANDLKCGYTTVCEWCRGSKVPRMNKVDQLCTYFGCKRSDLLEKRTKEPLSELDAILAKISATGGDLDTRFLREYTELSESQKALILDVIRQFKKD